MSNEPQRKPTVVPAAAPGNQKSATFWATILGAVAALVALKGSLAEHLSGLFPTSPETDTSWRWMVGIAVAVGLLAWLTR